jgi:hypothetical protein
MLFSKKGSLEISIQAIVIVVLAMTLLGLGLGFVKGMFRNIGGIQESVSDQIKAQILEDLKNTDKRISFPTTEIKIRRGDSTTFGIGVSNKNSNQISYTLTISKVNGPGDINIFQYSSQATPLDPVQSDVKSIRLETQSNTAIGSTLYNVKIMVAGAVYAEKDFFVVVQ